MSLRTVWGLFASTCAMRIKPDELGSTREELVRGIEGDATTIAVAAFRAWLRVRKLGGEDTPT